MHVIHITLDVDAIVVNATLPLVAKSSALTGAY